jgi:hypothetical protein
MPPVNVMGGMKDNQMKHIIIGIRGEAGTYVHTHLLNDRESGGVSISGLERWDRVIEGEYLSECVHGDEFDEMHVCVPYFNAEGYVKEVGYYVNAYPSKKVILYSNEVPLRVVEELSYTGSYVVARWFPKWDGDIAD